MRIALIQLNASDDPKENLQATREFVDQSVRNGARFILTPEVTNCVSTSRSHQRQVLTSENDDATLATLRDDAKRLGVWLLIGSLALKCENEDRFVNRSLLISPSGDIVARYDKIHMFDVDIDEKETYRESAGYRPGHKAVTADTPFGKLGLSICYDMRFPALYQALARDGAQILTVPAAFSPVTGAAHWHSLLRARAIETGCFVFAPAQTGTHKSATEKTRSTYGHSLVVSPWGEIILDAGTEPGVYPFDFEPESVDYARTRVPALKNARKFDGP